MAAFERAFAAGFGVETDIRDHNGVLVIAHDVPTGPKQVTFDEVLQLYKFHDCPGAFAINVKAAGLHNLAASALMSARVPNGFVFDMSVPDALGYLHAGLCTFTRHSEIEPYPAFYERANGVWVDCFTEDWITANVVAEHRAAGKQVALVSPELHGRAHKEVWADWAMFLRDPDVMLCTDFPDEAAQTFRGGNL